MTLGGFAADCDCALSRMLPDMGAGSAEEGRARTTRSYVDSRTKRALDIALALLLLLFFLPLLFLITLAVRLTSAGPIVFRQRRGGRDFRSFQILKFRSMYVQPEEAPLRQATRCDERVTPVGRVLRRTSADELMQLFNVLKGDMSIVGPRPHTLGHDRLFMASVPGYADRFGCRPGITGLAQIKGLRGETPTTDAMSLRVEADLAYLRTASLGGDLSIILKTAVCILFCHNAY